MKKKLVLLAAGVCAVSMLLTGCSKEISNEYMTISKYKGVEVQKVSTEVSDADVDAQIDALRQSNANVTEITDRAAELGDIATIDYVGKVNGEEFSGGAGSDYPLTLGSGQFIAGFEDGIVGHKAGETFDITVTFPNPYDPNPDLSGVEAVFTVTIKSLTQEELPELNDDFVKSVSEESKTVEEFKKEVKKGLEESNKASAEETLREEVWDVVMENTEMKKYPDDQVKEVSDEIKGQYEQMAEAYQVDFATLLSDYMGMDEETFNAELEKAAKEEVKKRMAVDLLAEKAKIDVSDKAINKKYEEFTKSYGYESVEDMLESAKGAGTEKSLEVMAKYELVRDWLAENCKQVDKAE